MSAGGVRQIGYLGLFVTSLAEWESFATEVLGFEVTGHSDDGSMLTLTHDAFDRRFILHQGAAPDLAYAGWEVFSRQELDAVAGRVMTSGAAVTEGARDECRVRGVLELRRFTDPMGNVVEVFYGPKVVDELDVSRHLKGRFVTGELGLGHYSLAVRDIDAFISFYQDALGLGLSGMRRDAPLGNGATTHVATLRCNERHHSLSIVQLDLPRKLLHIGLQVSEIDDLGRVMDVAGERDLISVPLGRHASDHMMSFYIRAPSGFQIEYGWGARTLPPDARIEQYGERYSIWGHKGIL
jgi:2,3-dihydroxybiphenyl 1,2-dioxygenase